MLQTLQENRRRLSGPLLQLLLSLSIEVMTLPTVITICNTATVRDNIVISGMDRCKIAVKDIGFRHNQLLFYYCQLS